MINYAAGGPTDIEGRLFARHLAKHIEGDPSIIIQNRDGANTGWGVPTGHLGEVAPRDGTVVGYLTGAAWQYIGDPTSHKVDFKSYEFVAYQPGTTIYYARTDVPPGLTQAKDLAERNRTLGRRPRSRRSEGLLLPRPPLDMLGIPFKYVTGYRSSAHARIALQRNEINMYSESPPKLSKRDRADGPTGRSNSALVRSKLRRHDTRRSETGGRHVVAAIPRVLSFNQRHDAVRHTLGRHANYSLGQYGNAAHCRVTTAGTAGGDRLTPRGRAESSKRTAILLKRRTRFSGSYLFP